MNTTKSSFEPNEPFKKDTKNNGNLPNFIIYIELYDFKNRKKLISNHHLSFTDLTAREVELESTNKILKLLSIKREKKEFIFFESRKKYYRWCFYINEKDIGTCILYVEKEKSFLIKNYSLKIQKILENINTDSENFENVLKTDFKNINKIINNSDNIQRDINYAIQKMNKILLKTEQQKEQLNRIDENMKEVKDDASEYKGNARGIRDESLWVNKKLRVIVIVVFVLAVLGLVVFFWMKFRRGSDLVVDDKVVVGGVNGSRRLFRLFVKGHGDKRTVV